MNNKLLKKFADLAVKVGVNIQKGQILVVNSPVECIELTRLIVESGYQAGLVLLWYVIMMISSVKHFLPMLRWKF